MTVVSDPLPQIVDGVPPHLRDIYAVIDREEFMFNPTNCEQQRITGTVSSDEGASSPLSVPFQVANCAALGFKPKFKVSTDGHASKADGASLTVKISYPSNALGTQAWLRSAKVDLPKSLPSRLTTLQRACTAAEFQANPASCPPESIVGHAVVHTQLLPVPLEGPAYFVSHGGEEFPQLIMVLQGDNVVIELVGDTFIKNGVTSSTFPNVPGVPLKVSN